MARLEKRQLLKIARSRVRVVGGGGGGGGGVCGQETIYACAVKAKPAKTRSQKRRNRD